MVKINIDGPDGNSFILIGYVKKFGRQLQWENEKIDSIIAKMMAGDRDNLLRVFLENFGEVVELEGKEIEELQLEQ